MLRETVTVVALLTAVAGCATADRTALEPAAHGGKEPATPASLAWVAAQHVGEPDSATAERDFAGELGKGAVGTQLRFGAGQDDGDMLVVAVGTETPDGLTCTPDHETRGGCVATDRGTLIWEHAAPGEDPGNVGVAVSKGDVIVLVFQSGSPMTRDPRRLQLPIGVEDMFEIASDPRTDLTTSEEAVSEGADAVYWRD